MHILYTGVAETNQYDTGVYLSGPFLKDAIRLRLVFGHFFLLIFFIYSSASHSVFFFVKIFLFLFLNEYVFTNFYNHTSSQKLQYLNK